MVKVGKKTFKNINQWQVDYIKENYQDKLTDIAEVIGVDHRRVGEIINLLELKRKRHWKLYLPKTKAVEKELKNPYLSHVELANKYNVSETCVAKRRKELGVNVRRKNYGTMPEKQVAKLLDELDLVFQNPKQISNWSIDFYLGCKHCIDVHGTWSHSKQKVKERDIRKSEYLNNSGYKYLVITEEELSDNNNVCKKIKDFVSGFPHLQK